MLYQSAPVFTNRCSKRVSDQVSIFAGSTGTRGHPRVGQAPAWGALWAPVRGRERPPHRIVAAREEPTPLLKACARGKGPAADQGSAPLKPSRR